MEGHSRVVDIALPSVKASVRQSDESDKFWTNRRMSIPQSGDWLDESGYFLTNWRSISARGRIGARGSDGLPGGAAYCRHRSHPRSLFMVVEARPGPNQAVLHGVEWSYSIRQLDAVGRIGQILDERAHERLDCSILSEFAAGLATGALYTSPIDRG